MEIVEFVQWVSIFYVPFIAAILTLIIVQIIKLFLRRNGILTEEISAVSKDSKLGLISDIVSFIMFTLIFLLDLFFIRKVTIIINEEFWIRISSGATLTWSLAKAIYTQLHQRWSKRV